MDGARGVVLRLTEDRYRLLRIEVDLGVTGRSARLCLALPAARGEAAPEPEGSDWTDRLHRSVLPAPTALTAVLHRMSLPISRLEDMVVGDVLPLEGVTVASIRLEGAGNTVVARARLGQVGGMKAVRLEEPPPPDMRDAAPPAGAPTRSSAPRAQAGPQVAVAHGDSVDGQVAVRTGPNDRVDAHRPGEDAPAATLEDAPGAMLDHAPAATLEDHGLSGRDGAGPAAAPPPQEAVAYPADPRAPREARELG
jgi:flagellar motor switch/type III secretory pathway protein FliN